MVETKITKSVGITMIASIVVGAFIGVWAKTLDPNGTGDNILILPVLVTLFPVCVALFITGVISLKKPFGQPLILASILIPICFQVARGFF